MLFCSLAAVTLLWVLLGPPDTPEPVRWAHITVELKSETNHLYYLRWAPPDSTLVDDSGNPLQPGAVYLQVSDQAGIAARSQELRDGLKPYNIEAKVFDPIARASGTIPGKILISVSEKSKRITLDLQIEPCGVASAYHQIAIEIDSDIGVTTDSIWFGAHLQEAGQDMTHRGTVTRWYKWDPSVGPKNDENAHIHLLFKVRDGRVRYVPQTTWQVAPP